ncbi:hypothetical protein HZH68_011105 [Vespula germanica]|uniref:Uncharacterized protein n=1 Tax=Vespula germanica TaxID=30212 RepID=A0A834N052_VESGE|nr:hypothetical protein HZH68_011105 [Vespula germanica]
MKIERKNQSQSQNQNQSQSQSQSQSQKIKKEVLTKAEEQNKMERGTVERYVPCYECDEDDVRPDEITQDTPREDEDEDEDEDENEEN